MLKRSQTMVKLGAAFCIAIVLFVLALWLKPGQTQTQLAEVQTGQGMALRPPALFQSVYAQDATPVNFSFILEEAGIASYTKLDQQLDLENLKARFKTVGKQTNEFISGIIVAPGYEKLPEFGENAEVQVFLHSDGWIIAYLTRWQPASAMFDWVSYDEKRLKDSTLLENVVRMLALDIGATDFEIGYYDFRNPEATSIMLIGDHADNIRRTESFQINIPREFIVYESSWSYSQFDMARENCNGCRYPGSCTLNNDDSKLTAYDTGNEKWELATGDLTKVKLALGKDQKFSVTGVWVRAYCGVAIIYKEAAK